MKENKKHSKLSKRDNGEKISRKDALKKAGLMVFSASTMMLLIGKTENAQAQDSPGNPDDPDNW